MTVQKRTVIIKHNTTQPFRNELNNKNATERRKQLMTNKRFITAKDVVEELGVSTSYAYKLIRELNAERAADGFVTIKGRVSRQYFDERIYGTTDKKEVV